MNQSLTLREESLWTAQAPLPPAPADAPLPARADVAIIGAGYTGLAAARALARRGARVVVFEAERIGWGASSRNGGMVLTGLKVGLETAIARYGREAARALFRASLASIDCVEQIVREEQIDCDFARCGHLEVACKPAHFAALARAAEVMAREGGHTTVRVLSRDELGAELGATIYHGGLVDETSAGLHPARYVLGLARAAERAGATLVPGTPAQAVAREHGGFAVRTARGTLRADAVFVATNGYTGAAVPALQRRVLPIGSYIIATLPLPDDLARALVPRNRMIFDSKNFLYYYRLTPDRRMLFGGRAAFFPETPATVRESAAILRRGMVSVFPQLAQTPVEYAWGGTLGFTFDLFPHAGQLDGVHYALGYAGHGVALATYLGTQMAGVIAGDGDAGPFGRLPFPTAPLGLYRGNPWFLPLVEWWYRWLDWVA
jgi:glycine/D-amino acid oxidase-like deaminating enzyme